VATARDEVTLVRTARGQLVVAVYRVCLPLTLTWTVFFALPSVKVTVPVYLGSRPPIVMGTARQSAAPISANYRLVSLNLAVSPVVHRLGPAGVQRGSREAGSVSVFPLLLFAGASSGAYCAACAPRIVSGVDPAALGGPWCHRVIPPRCIRLEPCLERGDIAEFQKAVFHPVRSGRQAHDRPRAAS